MSINTDLRKVYAFPSPSTDRKGCNDQSSERKAIKAISHKDVATLYKLGQSVMESTNTGMEVVFATRLADNEEVVIKTRSKATSFKSHSEVREWRATTEAQLNMPRVDAICELYEVLETKDTYYVVMEKVQGKDLFETMVQERIAQVDAREIIRQILSALTVLHNSGRIHKDLKLENVVVDLPPKAPMWKICRSNSPASTKSQSFTSRSQESNCLLSPTSPEAKLIDFDTVQDWEPSSPKSKDVLGTDGYIAPEAYGGEYSPASDIYCVGVIMYKLITRKFPSPPDIFDDKPGENWVGSPAMKRIQSTLRSSTIDFTRAPLDKCLVAADLCARMLTYDPLERPSAEEALSHAWFQLSPDELLPSAPNSTKRQPDPPSLPNTVRASTVIGG
jgi:serine/threonine protein kinase